MVLTLAYYLMIAMVYISITALFPIAMLFIRMVVQRRMKFLMDSKSSPMATVFIRDGRLKCKFSNSMIALISLFSAKSLHAEIISNVTARR